MNCLRQGTSQHQRKHGSGFVCAVPDPVCVTGHCSSYSTPKTNHVRIQTHAQPQHSGSWERMTKFDTSLSYYYDETQSQIKQTKRAESWAPVIGLDCLVPMLQTHKASWAQWTGLHHGQLLFILVPWGCKLPSNFICFRLSGLLWVNITSQEESSQKVPPGLERWFSALALHGTQVQFPASSSDGSQLPGTSASRELMPLT